VGFCSHWVGLAQGNCELFALEESTLPQADVNKSKMPATNSTICFMGRHNGFNGKFCQDQRLKIFNKKHFIFSKKC
jgi:hypothetical protein